ncbi:MAG TPA: hypothetical protein VFJ58_27815 [Armatimonadota bacterium]|nr:hypothetical protein [Armatimonadota bacterium]
MAAPGAGEITDLVAAPDGMVFGIAAGPSDRKLFVFDPTIRRVTHVDRLPFSGIIYNAASIGPGGLIYGLCAEGIFTIDPATREARILARSPGPITAGFALDGRDLYFASGAAIYRYRITVTP